jgi:hypothetical protein
MFQPRGNVTVERISVPSTLMEILLFSALYGLAGLLQIGIVLAVAAMLGRLSGFAFLMTSFLLSFDLRGTLAVNPLQFGVALVQKREIAEYVKVAQFLLTVIGLLIMALILAGYFPAIWEWRITWNESRYVVLSRWSFFNLYVGKWYAAGALEIITRALGILIAPMIGWPTLTMIRWASKMEVTRPKFREAQVAATSPETERGPFGEVYRERAVQPKSQIEPLAEPYIGLVEE